ncbi:MAG TPA: pimeloyl-ACP methyl ester esterase BioH [Gammaproteobacteria bacterium]|nr:pimeloyl-ACP methyl ester esterase BioH [Gammaproteobacteria bacterium]
MTLHVETLGRGPALVLVHGWGVNSGVWQALLPQLMSRYRVTCVDLPGHGESRALPMPATLAALAAQVSAAVPAEAVWLGWSLGGLVSLRAALDFPGRLRGLVLSNTTARFCSAPDWPHAMPPAQLTRFADELVHDFAGTMQRFLALQTLGDEHARTTLRVLRDSVAARGAPDAASLATGLALLRDSDLRPDLPALRLPARVLAGEYDRLTPPAAAQELAQRIGGADCVTFARCAHAPFISHPAGFMQRLDEFMSVNRADPVTRHAG